MTALPSWLWALSGGFLGAGGRALLDLAAQRIGGGVFRRLAMAEMLGAALLGLGVGWLTMRPEPSLWPDELTRFAVLCFIVAVPGLGRKDHDQGDAFFRMLLTLGALFAGAAAGRFLFA